MTAEPDRLRDAVAVLERHGGVAERIEGVGLREVEEQSARVVKTLRTERDVAVQPDQDPHDVVPDLPFDGRHLRDSGEGVQLAAPLRRAARQRAVTVAPFEPAQQADSGFEVPAVAVPVVRLDGQAGRLPDRAVAVAARRKALLDSLVRRDDAADCVERRPRARFPNAPFVGERLLVRPGGRFARGAQGRR